MYNITQTNITVMVSDMNKAIHFYVNLLGFTLIQQYGNHYAQISAPGIVIGLHPAKSELNSSGNVSIGFTVNSFNDAKEHLQKSGIAYVERSEQGGNFIHFKDPAGSELYFIDPKK